LANGILKNIKRQRLFQKSFRILDTFQLKNFPCHQSATWANNLRLVPVAIFASGKINFLSLSGDHFGTKKLPVPFHSISLVH